MPGTWPSKLKKQYFQNQFRPLARLSEIVSKPSSQDSASGIWRRRNAASYCLKRKLPGSEEVCLLAGRYHLKNLAILGGKDEDETMLVRHPSASNNIAFAATLSRAQLETGPTETGEFNLQTFIREAIFLPASDRFKWALNSSRNISNILGFRSLVRSWTCRMAKKSSDSRTWLSATLETLETLETLDMRLILCSDWKEWLLNGKCLPSAIAPLL